MKLARLLKKKAFTLVELIIAMAIMMILIVAAMSMFNPVSSIITVSYTHLTLPTILRV